MRTPLPAELATPARAYLAAFLGETEAADALHEVAEDAAYWGDDSLPAILAVAHEVLRSRARVTDEAAASWLIDELKLDPAVARLIIGLSDDTPTTDPSATEVSADDDADADPDEPTRAERHHEPVAAVPERDQDEPAPPRDRSDRDDGRIRIGFDEEPIRLSAFEEDARISPALRAAGVLVLIALVALAIWLVTRG